MKVTHIDAVCVQVPFSEGYSNKNWSAAFKCPTCERTGRFSLNFLGSKRIVCDGAKFVKVPRWQADTIA